MLADLTLRSVFLSDVSVDGNEGAKGDRPLEVLMPEWYGPGRARDRRGWQAMAGMVCARGVPEAGSHTAGTSRRSGSGSLTSAALTVE
jgi:hypothetical protein